MQNARPGGWLQAQILDVRQSFLHTKTAPKGRYLHRERGRADYFFLPAFGLVFAAGFFTVVFFIVHLAGSVETDAHSESTLGAAPLNDNALPVVVHSAGKQRCEW
jgi:hypothetical protein